MQEIQGAYHINGFDGGFHIRLKFRCPFCSKRHTQFIDSKDSAPTGVELTTKCGEMIRVAPYRPLK
jgi:hypothetical protein